MFSPTADRLPTGEPRFLCAWGGGPRGEGEGQWRTVGRKRTVAFGKPPGALDGLVHDSYTIFPAFWGTQGSVPACYLPHGAVVAIASLTCCVVAGSKVSPVHLSVLIRTWKLF